MAFELFSPSNAPSPLRGRRLLLRIPDQGDWQEWARLRAESRDHLVPWEPRWPADALTRAAFRRRLRAYQREMREGIGYAFFIFEAGSQTLLGGITLSNIRRGVAQSGMIGYWLGVHHTGKGYMREALSVLAEWAFAEQGLHRLEAACLPANTASRRVLEACGFRHEGLGRGYLRINGVWQDHLLYARLAGDVVSPPLG